MNKYENLFTEFLDVLKFNLVKCESDENDVYWTLVDKKKENIDNIEENKFNSAKDIFEKMDTYINDYFITDLKESLKKANYDIPEYNSYMDLANYCEPLLTDNQWDIAIIDMISNHADEIDLKNIKNSSLCY